MNFLYSFFISNYCTSITQGGQKTWKNLEFDNLGKNKPGKAWNLRDFEKTLEF